MLGYITGRAGLNQIEQAIRKFGNFPMVGRNAATGELAPDKQQVTEYSTLLRLAGQPDQFAVVGGPDFVDWLIAEGYSDNLTEGELAFVDAYKAAIVELGPEWDDAVAEPWD